MKKLLIFLFAVLISACSTSDDPKEMAQDPVIGIWKPTREVAVLNDGSEISEAVSVCEQKNRITFFEDGRFSMTDYPESNDPDCMQPVGNLFLSGTWTRIFVGHYIIVLECMIPDCNETQVEEPDEISFPSNNLMRVRENDDNPNDNINYFYLEFSRVE